MYLRESVNKKIAYYFPESPPPRGEIQALGGGGKMRGGWIKKNMFIKDASEGVIPSLPASFLQFFKKFKVLPDRLQNLYYIYTFVYSCV